MFPCTVTFADPLQNIHSYTTHDYGSGGITGPRGRLFGWPFHGIIAGTIAYPVPWTNLLMSFFWIGLVLLGTGMMFTASVRKYARTYPNEAIFCGLYLLATFSYDYLLWARSNFIRFSIPILPFVFFAVLPLLPKDRRFLWLLCFGGAVLATLSAVGVRNVVGHS